MYFIKTPQIFKAIWPHILWDCPEGRVEFQLTFDDGPSKNTARILDFLAEDDVKATFFCLGRQIEKYPALFSRIKAEGHLIGNHGYAHLDGWQTNCKTYIEDVERGYEISGSTYFRPPFGRLTPKQYRYIKERFQIVMWSRMPGDFVQGQSSKIIRQRIAAAKNRDIIVLHDQDELNYNWMSSQL